MTEDTHDADDVDDSTDPGVVDEHDRDAKTADSDDDGVADDDDPADSDDDGVADDDDPADSVSPVSRSSVHKTVTGVLVVAVVALAALLFMSRSDRADLQDQIDRETDIAQAASEFSVAVLTYDHTDVDASAAAIEELSTDNFAAEYREGFQGNLRALIVESEATSVATVDEIFVNRTTGDTARVIAVATADVRSAAQSRAEVTSFVDLAMVRVDGRWLVNEMVSLGSEGSILDEEGNPISPPSDAEAEGSGADPSSDATTTTTPPG